MNSLMTKNDVTKFLGLKTTQATDKLLKKLGVPRVDFSTVGSKGIRYRKIDIEEAIEKMEVKQGTLKKSVKPKKCPSVFFDLPVNEQFLFLTTNLSRQ